MFLLTGRTCFGRKSSFRSPPKSDYLVACTNGRRCTNEEGQHLTFLQVLWAQGAFKVVRMWSGAVESGMIEGAVDTRWHCRDVICVFSENLMHLDAY